MARHESDREDILREATALARRAELQCPGQHEPVVVGFRRDGAASLFLGADPVYQFNTSGELRRAYLEGLLYKAERGRLVSLRRERNAAEIALLRHELTAEEEQAVLDTLHDDLAGLREAITTDRFNLVGEVPADGQTVERIRAWLAGLPARIAIAAVPNVR